MTRKQREVIERARMTPPRFVTIRKGRFAAHFNLQDAQQAEAKHKATECLEAEQQRLLKLWTENE